MTLLPLNNNNTTVAQTFEDSKGVGVIDEEDSDDGEAKTQLALQKEQLEVAKSLVLKQKGEMLAMVMKMREMNSELKTLRAQAKTNFAECYHVEQADAACQTTNQQKILVACGSEEYQRPVSLDYCTTENNDGPETDEQAFSIGKDNGLQAKIKSMKQSSVESNGLVIRVISLKDDSS